MSLNSPSARNVYLPVLHNKEIAPGIFRLAFEDTVLSKMIKPGQFLMLGFPHLKDPLLPRPLAAFNVAGDLIEVLYQRVGKGTGLLSRMGEGELLRVFGPLGNGFSLPLDTPSLIIVGGMGIASVHLLILELLQRDLPPMLLYGSRTNKGLLPLEILEEKRLAIHLATEDGTRGLKGTTLDLLQHLSEQTEGFAKTYKEAFVCGPMAMLKALAGFLDDYGINSQVSLESRMACGYGVCQGCVIPTRDFKNPDNIRYQKVCVDGPVFNGEEICWEAL